MTDGGEKMAFCKNCGKELEEGAKFCPACGAACKKEDNAPKGGTDRNCVDYDELKFSASVCNADKYRKRLTVVYGILTAVVIAELILGFVSYSANGKPTGDSAFEGKFSIAVFALLCILAIVYAVYIVIGYFKKFTKIFGSEYSENTSLGDARMLCRFTNALQATPVILIAIGIYVVFTSFMGVTEVNFLSEPELYQLVYGKAACALCYISVAAALLSVAAMFAVIVVARMHKNIYRYFKSKVSPDSPEPLTDRRASDEAKKKNKLLVAEADKLTFGAAFGEIYNVYAGRFAVKTGEVLKDGNYNIKADAACVKFTRVKNLVMCVPVLILLVIAAVWAGVAVSYCKKAVRPGSVGKVRLGYSVSEVTEALGKPDFEEPQNLYYFDADSVKSLDDLDKIKQVAVRFEDGRVVEVVYDAKGSLSDSENDNDPSVKARKVIKEYGYGADYVEFYADGSVRMYTLLTPTD